NEPHSSEATDPAATGSATAPEGMPHRRRHRRRRRRSPHLAQSDATHRTGDVENGALTTEGAARDPAPTETAAPGGTGTQRHTLHLRHLRRRHRRARPVPRLGSGEGDVAPPGETASGEQPPGALNEATAIGEPTPGETTP